VDVNQEEHDIPGRGPNRRNTTGDERLNGKKIRQILAARRQEKEEIGLAGPGSYTKREEPEKKGE